MGIKEPFSISQNEERSFSYFPLKPSWDCNHCEMREILPNTVSIKITWILYYRQYWHFFEFQWEMLEDQIFKGSDWRPRIFLGWSVSAKCNFMLHSEEVEEGQTDGQGRGWRAARAEGFAREVWWGGGEGGTKILSACNPTLATFSGLKLRICVWYNKKANSDQSYK